MTQEDILLKNVDALTSVVLNMSANDPDHHEWRIRTLERIVADFPTMEDWQIIAYMKTVATNCAKLSYIDAGPSLSTVTLYIVATMYLRHEMSTMDSIDPLPETLQINLNKKDENIDEALTIGHIKAQQLFASGFDVGEVRTYLKNNTDFVGDALQTRVEHLLWAYLKVTLEDELHEVTKIHVKLSQRWFATDKFEEVLVETLSNPHDESDPLRYVSRLFYLVPIDHIPHAIYRALLRVDMDKFAPNVSIRDLLTFVSDAIRQRVRADSVIANKPYSDMIPDLGYLIDPLNHDDWFDAPGLAAACQLAVEKDNVVLPDLWAVKEYIHTELLNSEGFRKAEERTHIALDILISVLCQSIYRDIVAITDKWKPAQLGPKSERVAARIRWNTEYLSGVPAETK